MFSPTPLRLAVTALLATIACSPDDSTTPPRHPTTSSPTASTTPSATPTVPFPSATAVGKYSAADVRAALVTVRDLVGASYKNVSVLRGETLDPLPNLWTAKLHERYAALEQQWRRSRESRFLVLVSTFDTTKQVPVEPYLTIHSEQFHAPKEGTSDHGNPGLAITWDSEISYHVTEAGSPKAIKVRRTITYLLIRSGTADTPWLVDGYTGRY